MEFTKYQHVERYGTDEVDDIHLGECWIFPKLDGTNGSAWTDKEGKIKAGSRNRELTLDYDNQGFYHYVLHSERITNFLLRYNDLKLYGEWLVPHSLKTYRDDAWKRFWIFDVTKANPKSEHPHYIPYEEYKPLLDEFELDYVIPIEMVVNPTLEDLERCMERNTFLIQEGKGVGEGVVIKNYEYINKYGRKKWAKLVRNEFRELNAKEFGTAQKENRLLEQEIVDEHLTASLVEKTYSKIVNDKDGWKSQYIPELLGRVYHDLVDEEIWNVVKKKKNPTINFRNLKYLSEKKVKEVKPELF